MLVRLRASQWLRIQQKHSNSSMIAISSNRQEQNQLSSRYGRVIVQRRLNKFQEAKAEVAELISEYPELSEFYIESSHIDRDNIEYLRSMETINIALFQIAVIEP